SNHRHADFQSAALPTELPGQRKKQNHTTIFWVVQAAPKFSAPRASALRTSSITQRTSMNLAPAQSAATLRVDIPIIIHGVTCSLAYRHTHVCRCSHVWLEPHVRSGFGA